MFVSARIRFYPCQVCGFMNVIQRNIRSADLQLIHESTDRYVVRLSPYLRSWHQPIHPALHARIMFPPRYPAIITYCSLIPREKRKTKNDSWHGCRSHVSHAGKSSTVCPRCMRFSSASVPFKKGMHDDGWGISSTSIHGSFEGALFSEANTFSAQRTFPGSNERCGMHDMMQFLGSCFRWLDRGGWKSVSYKEALVRQGESSNCTTAGGTRGRLKLRRIETRQDRDPALAGKASKSQPVLATKPEEEQVDGTRALVNRRKQLGGLSVGAATACTFICRKKVKYFRQLRSGHAWYFSLVLADNKVFKDHKIWINAFCLKQSFDMFILFCFCVQNWYIPLCHDRVKTRQSLSQAILGPQK